MSLIAWNEYCSKSYFNDSFHRDNESKWLDLPPQQVTNLLKAVWWLAWFLEYKKEKEIFCRAVLSFIQLYTI